MGNWGYNPTDRLGAHLEETCRAIRRERLCVLVAMVAIYALVAIGKLEASCRWGPVIQFVGVVIFKCWKKIPDQVLKHLRKEKVSILIIVYLHMFIRVVES